MTERLTIRRAELTDLDRLAPLFDGYRRFYRRQEEPDRVRAFLTDRLRNRDSIIFLAFIEGQPLPVGFTQLYPTYSSVSIGRSLILNDLFVDPAGRGHGVGRALLERAAQFGRATGALYLELATEVSNAPAQALYEQAGWRRDTDFYHYSLDLR
jgi:GNAT superfamily N-acetyltransferase